mgnify:CR=1 FL=1
MLAKPIVTNTYLDPIEIAKHLTNVEYIIMAAPAPSNFTDTPIQFTIFLNTQDEFAQDIKNAILDKFLDEEKIINPVAVLSQLMPVGFGKSSQDTPMPMLLVKPEDQNSVPNCIMHVIDFLGDSDEFSEAKNDSLTGWTYSYN